MAGAATDTSASVRYGTATRTIHWSMAVAILAQFIVGYSLDGASGRGRGRGRGRGEGSGQGRGRGRGGDIEVFGDDTLLTVHVVLGLTILVLAIARVVWRWRSDLPPWAPTLSARERVIAHWTERALYVTMFAIPITGLAMVVTGDDDLVGFHVAAHLLFFVAISAHLGLVLKHQLIDRDHLVRRML
jgi:cytochrome b561